MVNNSAHDLNRVFSALADPTRRGILAMLANGDRPVSDLAQPYGMSLPGFMKHLRILEEASLIRREKSGRVVNCALAAAPMKDAADWIARYRSFWEQRLDALARYLEREKEPWPKSPRSPSSARSAPRQRKSGTRSPRHKR